MRKLGKAGLALVIAGILIFGAGLIGARGDLSVVNGSIGPFRVQLTDGRVHSGLSFTGGSSGGDSSASGIGGGRSKPMTTPPPAPTPAPTPVPTPPHGDSAYHDEQHHTDDAYSQSFPSKDVRKLEMDVSCADVVICPTETMDDIMYVYVTCDSLDDFRVELDKNGVLKVESRNKMTVFGLGGDCPTLTVMLPREFVCPVEVDSSYGDITLERLNLAEVELDSDMGNVHMKHTQCFSADLSSDCGSVQALNVDSSGELSVESDMGDVFVANGRAGGKLTAESSCGKVTVNDISAAEAEISADMGDISLHYLTCERTVKLDCDCGSISFTHLSAGKGIEIDNDMGSIEGSLPGSITDYSIESGTDLGSNNLPAKLELGSIKLKAHSSCGSIDISFEDD